MKELPVGKIDITINDTSNLYSPFYRNNESIISNEFAEFITDSASDYKIRQKLELNIYSDSLNDEEKDNLKKAIKNYYVHNNIDNHSTLLEKTINSIIFIAVGILGLFLMILLNNLEIRDIWTEIVDIFSWVFIWGSVDIFFIQRVDIKKRYIKNLQLINMTINFHNITK